MADPGGIDGERAALFGATNMLERGVDEPLTPGTIVGEFSIEAQIGQGGFGAVYRAKHPLIGKRAAIKVLSDDVGASANAVARFVQEARAVNEIQHPNIVDIFSFGQLVDGRHYFAMEILDGQTFDAFLRKRDPISVGELVCVLDPVVSALDAAHKKGIIHRDLKPENIFLCFHEGRMTKVKLLDFGIAKLSGDSLQGGSSPPKTKTGSPLGTPAFMAPEQALGREATAAADVYALGVICHLALTGEPPFYSDSLINLLALHINAPPPPMSMHNRDVAPELDAIVLRMLAKAPEVRFASAGEALDALVSAAKEAGLEADRRAQIVLTEQPAHPRTRRANQATAASAGTGKALTTDAPQVKPRSRAAVIATAIAALVIGGVSIATYARLTSAVPSKPLSSAPLNDVPTALQTLSATGLPNAAPSVGSAAPQPSGSAPSAAPLSPLVAPPPRGGRKEPKPPPPGASASAVPPKQSQIDGLR